MSQVQSIAQTKLRPTSAGAGLNQGHAPAILGDGHAVDFFEIRAEDYMGAGGPRHRLLRQIRERYPITICSLGLSLGADQTIDRNHILRLRHLIDCYQPSLIAEHLAWSAHDGAFFNASLPLPYNDETLAQICNQIDDAQHILGTQILLTTPPAYLTFESSNIPETEFLRAVVSRTGCGLLLDISHVYMSAINLDFEPMDYLDSFPIEHVREVHLAGFSEDADDDGARLLIDQHGSAVSESIWSIYRRALARMGPVPTAVEQDAQGFSELAADVARANEALRFEATRRARKRAS